jgi:hypothetical protein
MPSDRSAAELERFLAERAGHLLCTAVLLAGGREAGADLLRTAVERLWHRWRRFEGGSRGIPAPDAVQIWRPTASGGSGRWRQKERLLRAEPPQAEDPVGEVGLHDAVFRCLVAAGVSDK